MGQRWRHVIDNIGVVKLSFAYPASFGLPCQSRELFEHAHVHTHVGQPHHRVSADALQTWRLIGFETPAENEVLLLACGTAHGSLGRGALVETRPSLVETILNLAENSHNQVNIRSASVQPVGFGRKRPCSVEDGSTIAETSLIWSRIAKVWSKPAQFCS